MPSAGKSQQSDLPESQSEEASWHQVETGTAPVVAASSDPCEDHVMVEILVEAGLLAVGEAGPAGTEAVPLASVMAGRAWHLAHCCKVPQRTDNYHL